MNSEKIFYTRIKFWSGSKMSLRSPIIFLKDGNIRSRKAGTATLKFRLKKSTMSIRLVSRASSRLNRSPPTNAHKMLRTERLKIPLLKSTILSGSEVDWSLMTWINSRISSWIISSADVRPNPRSLRCRKVNRLCSRKKSPSINIKPVLVLYSNHQIKFKFSFPLPCH